MKKNKNSFVILEANSLNTITSLE